MTKGSKNAGPNLFGAKDQSFVPKFYHPQRNEPKDAMNGNFEILLFCPNLLPGF